MGLFDVRPAAERRRERAMKRAVLMFDGPKRNSRYCEGCALYDAAMLGGGTCPIWGMLYQETDGEHRGCWCREVACMDNETAVANPEKRASIWAALENGP